MPATLLDRPLPAPEAAIPPRQATRLARLGRYDVDLAACAREREAAYALRYRVFVEEGGALPPSADPVLRRECQDFDDGAAHILVRPRANWGRDLGLDRPVLGTCRVRIVENARAHPGGAADLFDLAPLFGAHPDLLFCEVGRSCVAPEMRGGPVLNALWCGLYAYARTRGVDCLFGSASLPGADPAVHAGAIGAILAGRQAAGRWTVAPHAHCAAGLRADPDRTLEPDEQRALPALLRGYLHMGAIVGTDAACDPAFDTTDLFVITPLATIPGPYRRHFGRATGLAR